MKTITVHSYRGGTGKSLIALNLAHRLSKENKRVLLIETDVRMPSLSEILGLKTKNTFNNYYNGKCRFTEAIYPSKYGISVICCSPKFSFSDKTFSVSQTVHTERFQDMMLSLRNVADTYDFCIIDSGPGWGFIQINNGLLADQIILIMRSGKTAFSGTKRMIQDIYSKVFTLGKKFIIVWNLIPKSPKFKKYIDGWNEELNETGISLHEFYYLYYNEDILCEIAEGNHIINNNKEFNNEIYKLSQSIINPI